MAAGDQYQQMPRSAGERTVPKDSMAAPVQPQAYPGPSQDVPMQVPHGQSIPPAKPSATTGPGGSGVSLPRVGKSGK